MTSNRKAVNQFLTQLKDVIDDPNFSIEENLFLIGRPENKATLIDLDYDSDDVVKILSELNIENYSETLFDEDNDNPPLLFVFGKEICEKEIYIKIKVRMNPETKIVCVSFHWAQHTMLYPYK